MNTNRSLHVTFVAAILAVLFALPLSAAAQEDDQPITEGPIGNEEFLGVGLGHGTLTTGLTAKYYLQEYSAIQVFFGTYGSWGGCFSCGLSLSGDYLYEFQDLVSEPDTGRLFVGLGGGAFVYRYTFDEFVFFDEVEESAWGFGINGTAELGWHFYEFPLELVIDLRPTFSFGDTFGGYWDGFFISGGSAIRYYF